MKLSVVVSVGIIPLILHTYVWVIMLATAAVTYDSFIRCFNGLIVKHQILISSVAPNDVYACLGLISTLIGATKLFKLKNDAVKIPKKNLFWRLTVCNFCKWKSLILEAIKVLN